MVRAAKPLPRGKPGLIEGLRGLVEPAHEAPAFTASQPNAPRKRGESRDLRANAAPPAPGSRIAPRLEAGAASGKRRTRAFALDLKRADSPRFPAAAQRRAGTQGQA
ncbi:MAG: hypothetical protein BroJett013_28260 [Alphaproteobacteria bacterium]|nr:MAG: hypothetical protein BroJett013_28260 [Alphaproteobacteria bacterium]